MRLLALVCLAACNSHPGVFGKTGEPFGLFANVRMGMAVDDVTKIAPDLKPDPKDPNHRSADAADGMRYDAYFIDGHLSKFEIQPPLKVHRADLERAWGVPRQVDSQLAIVYTNATKTLRVEGSTGDTVNLTYLPMVPAEKLLGKDTFDGVKLMGRPIADVKRELADKLHLRDDQWTHTDYHAEIENIFPATELWRGTALDISSGPDAIVNRWAVIGSYDSDPAAQTGLSELCEKLWGKPRTEGDNVVYGTDPVTVVEKSGAVIEGLRLEARQLHDLK
jgi:hypothetical protein